MKTTLLSFILFAVGFTAFADTTKYEKVMLQAIDSIYSAKTIEQYQAAINKLDMISAKEADKWEPIYYAGFGYLMMANSSQDSATKDKYLDLALNKVKSGLLLAPQESELVALEGFVHMIRVTVDPATRGQQYAGLAMQTFGKALALNPENPRALYLMGQMEFGTAQFFGSGTEEACTKLKGAVAKFETYKSDNILSPTWGNQGAIKAAERCE